MVRPADSARKYTANKEIHNHSLALRVSHIQVGFTGDRQMALILLRPRQELLPV